MTLETRRERQFAEREQAIVDAALAIATEHGWDAVTIRRVADAIEYSVPTIYEHFESKQAMLLQLLRNGFAQLCATLEAAAPTGRKPTARLLARCEACWTFAHVQPRLYELMHDLGGVSFGTDATPPEARRSFALLREALVDAAVDMKVRLPAADEHTEALWALTHGFLALTLTGRIKGTATRSHAVWQRAVHDLLRAWHLD